MLKGIKELFAIRSAIVYHTLRRSGLRGLLRLFHLKWRQLRSLRLSFSPCQTYRIVSNINGFNMLIQPADRGIGRELTKYKLHEPILTRVIQGLIEHGSTILDVGANVGYYTLLCSKLVGENGTVIAVEPEENNYRVLRRNLRLNRISNVHVLRAAVGKERSTGKLFVSAFSNWHSLHQMDWTSVGVQEVQMLTIDDILAQTGRNVALIRMDIEGYETAAIAGAVKTLTLVKPVLVVEVHPSQIGSRDAVCAFLKDLENFGYNIDYLILRGDDYPWAKNSDCLYTPNWADILQNPVLLDGPEAFELVLRAQNLE